MTVSRKVLVLTGEQLKHLPLHHYFRMDIMWESLDKMLKEEPSLIDMLMYSIKIRWATTTPLMQLSQRKMVEPSLLQTLISLNLLSWVLNSATLKLIPIHLLYGKHNLEILLMAHKLLLISSIALERQNGTWKTDLWCCFHMDMMVMVPNILQVDSKGTCYFVIRMNLYLKILTMTTLTCLKVLICKLLCQRLLPTTSIFSEDTWDYHSESR